MSARGLCLYCGTGNQRAEIIQLAEHHGPYFQHWRRRMAACVGGVLPDDG